MSLVLQAKRQIPLSWSSELRRTSHLLGPTIIQRGIAGRMLALRKRRTVVPSLPFGIVISSLPRSMTKVDYHCSGIPYKLTRLTVPAAARDLIKVLDHMKLKHHQVDLHFCGDVLMRKLNAHHRFEDKTTDVISLSVPEEMQNDQYNLGLLGEMFISMETANVQAIARGHPLSDELRILMVHSVLHLLGDDHVKDAEAAAMEARENKILAELNWTPKSTNGGLLTSGDVLGDNPERSSSALDAVIPKIMKEETERKMKKAKKIAAAKQNKVVKPQSVLGNKSKKGKTYKPVAWKK